MLGLNCTLVQGYYYLRSRHFQNRDVVDRFDRCFLSSSSFLKIKCWRSLPSFELKASVCQSWIPATSIPNLVWLQGLDRSQTCLTSSGLIQIRLPPGSQPTVNISLYYS